MHVESLEPRICRSGTVAGTIQTLNSAGTVGEYTSTAIDPVNQQPAVAYYDVTNKDLDFTRFDGKIWHTVVVDSSGDVGKYASLKFDASGNPWIAYYDATNADLKLAHFNGKKWSTQIIDSNGGEGQYASLALTRAGLPVIAYQGTSGTKFGALKLATDTGKGWSIGTVDKDAGKPFPVAFCSLALDSNDRPYIAYESSEVEYAEAIPLNVVEYAVFDGKSWTRTAVDTGPFGGGTGQGVDLVLDSHGDPHISYSQPESDGGTEFGDDLEAIVYAQLNGSGKWTFDTTNALPLGQGSVGDDGDETAMVLKSNGEPIIAYNRYARLPFTDGTEDPTKSSVVIATLAGAKFTDKFAGSSSNIGNYISMAMNKKGEIFAAYFDPVADDLKLFTFS